MVEIKLRALIPILLASFPALALAQPVPNGVTIQLVRSDRSENANANPTTLRVISIGEDSALVQILGGDGLVRSGCDTAGICIRSSERGTARIVRVDSIVTLSGLALTFDSP